MKKYITALLCAAALALCACNAQNGKPEITEPAGSVDLSRAEETIILQTEDRTETLVRRFDSSGRLTTEITKCVLKTTDCEKTVENTVKYYESGRVKCESTCTRRTYPYGDGKLLSHTESDEISVRYADTDGHEITEKRFEMFGQPCRIEYYTTVTDTFGNSNTYLSMVKDGYSLSRAGETCWVTEYDEHGNETRSYGIGIQ